MEEGWLVEQLQHTQHFSIIFVILCPGQVAQLIRVPFPDTKVAGSIPGQGKYKNQPKALTGEVQWFGLSCTLKGHWFNSSSGHMSGLQAMSLPVGMREATD